MTQDDEENYLDDMMHVQVRLPRLIAKIKAGDFRQHFALDPLHLEATAEDPSNDTAELIYTWSCVMINIENMTMYTNPFTQITFPTSPECTAPVTATERDFDQNTTLFETGAENIAMFILQVNSTDGRSSSDVQAVEILDKAPPALEIL